MYKALVDGHFFLADTYLDVTRRQGQNSSAGSGYGYSVSCEESIVDVSSVKYTFLAENNTVFNMI